MIELATADDATYATAAFPLTDLQAAYMVGTTRLIELGGFRPTWFVDVEAVGFDPARAAAALDRVIQRHEHLRTVMRPDGTQRVLSVAAAQPSPLAARDLRGAPPERQAEILSESRRDLYDTGPDPSAWPLFRVSAFRLRTHRWRLHIALSLPLLDGHGIRQVVADWLRWYAEPDAALPAVPSTYREVLADLRAADDSAHWAYWRDRLDTLADAPALPLRHQPASLDPVRFTRRAHALDREQWQRLCRNFRTRRMMPTTALLHVFTEVLGAWSTSPRFCVNILHQSWAADHPHSAEVVGQFGSNIPLAVDLSADTDFWARGQALQRQLWADLAHAGVSAVRISRELATRRGWTSRAALPYVFTSMIGSGPEPPAPPGLALRLSDSALRTPHVLLDNQVQDGPGGGAVCVWDTVDDAFPDGLPEAMFAAYARMLDTLAATDTPRAPDPVPPEHRSRIAALNPAPVGVPTGRLEDGFLDRAAGTPDATAVATSTGSLTYRDVDRRSAAVAHWLRAHGIGAGDLVPVIMAKGWEQVVAVLGVLRAGAAYCPVDAALPAERIRHLVDQTGARVALEQSAHPCVGVPCPALQVDTAGECEPTAVPRLDGGGGSLAYVIYTSGSTGRPKGASLAHAAALNTVLDVNRRIGLGPLDRVLAISSLSFDLSVWDVFGTLAAGGTIVVPDPAPRPDPAAWAALASRHRVTVWNSVPALAEMLAEVTAYEPSAARPPLRAVLLSGDWVPTSLPDRLRDLWPGLRVVAMGGATEAAIWSNIYEVVAVDPGWRAIPYGRPLTNQTMVVLDDQYRLRPPWATGGIFIGGAGLALGYWRDPERTAERFVRHPVTGEPLYRTGDLGRYWPDGTIEFLGREDRQVKIQGFRVEPGEVEAALAAHPGVREAAVCVVDTAGQRRLVAFAVGRPDAWPRPTDLTAHLRGTLPHYLVPARIQVLDALPLSENGKVDVARALAGLDQAADDDGGAAAGADGATIGRMRALWADVLGSGVAAAQPDADFFASGGTSLLALRLVHRIRDEFGVELPLGQVFEAPTPHALAARIGDRPVAPTSAVVLRDTTGPALVLFHPVGGSIAAYLGMARAWPGRVVALQCAGLTDDDAPRHTDLEGMAAAYRREVEPARDLVLAGWSMGGVLAHEVGRQLAAEGVRADVCMIDSTVTHAEPSDDVAAHREFLTDLAGGRLTGAARRALAGMTTGAPIEVARLLAATPDLLPAGLGLTEYQRLTGVHRANLSLLARHRPGPSPQRTMLHVAARLDRPDPVRGWRAICPDLTVEMWPDDHYSIVEPARLSAITARLLAWRRL